MRTSLYPAVDELERRARALVRAAPGLLRLEKVGQSRAGRPLWLLSAGHADRHILAVAGAHANEPVGGASALRLAALFAGRPELLERLGCAWHFLLCLDPDGAHLAHGWQPEEPEPSLTECHRGFYRPAFARQPESLPLPPGEPLPESATLVRILDELRPLAQFTLHGIEFGGAFVMMTRTVPGVADAFRRTAARLRIPVDRHPVDGPDWRLDPPGVLVLPDGHGAGERDPSGFVAESTWFHPRRHGTVTTLIETPAWAVPSVSDARPVTDPDRAAARLGEVLLGRSRELAAVLGTRLDGAVPEELAPLRDAARELLGVAPSIVDSWAAEEPGLFRGYFATRGISARRIPLRVAAMASRALARTDPRTVEILDDLVREWSQELEKTYDLRWVPVAAQTGLHVRTMLDTARLLCDRR
ncbi:M14 family zinc carboxypeptidase [Streptomyces griseorubiginosus]|uniref:M14 family zinc carboxypeptidase n=1 Tax=Streptomyces griseorubiginosus TaxID=67304 RepID=UPI002E7FE3DB|nr:M14 family zinc carboxypeptidase [Streptomyces griseorubiginosus]WUB47024.1 M14 family zinc carboxypeptidase [Streptomyces griseorubiginosus]WUB55546.1 M14 family zinc carboxypeptidase [Streptomyces griseorubiginosus]